MNLISTLHLKQNNMELRDLRYSDNVLRNGKVITITGILDRYDSNIITFYDSEREDYYSCYITDLKPIPISDALLLKLGFDKHDCSDLGLDIEYELATKKGFISVSNVSNSKGKDYSVQIDNLAHTSVGGMDIACLHELQHIVWDCLKVELKIEL